MAKDILNNFKEIVIEKPADKIIKQIKELISSGRLNPGDKLPSERALSDLFGVGRTNVRDAIRKLEFYGILKTLPQSGTVVAGIGITALEGLITDVLQVEVDDFHSLVETRVMLETNAVKYAAMRRTKDDLIAISNALNAYDEALAKGKNYVEYDFLFHLKIAEASKNTALKSLMLVITPDILSYFMDNNVCEGSRPVSALDEHHEILKHISDQNAAKAEEAMNNHLQDLLTYSVEKNGFNNK